MPEFEENDVILFEDDTILIWHCRFMLGVSVPPHDHQMSAIIGVYHGIERNDFYESDRAGGIRQGNRMSFMPELSGTENPRPKQPSVVLA